MGLGSNLILKFFKDYTLDDFTILEVGDNFVIAECPKSMTSYVIKCMNYYLRYECNVLRTIKGLVVSNYQVKFQII